MKKRGWPPGELISCLLEHELFTPEECDTISAILNGLTERPKKKRHALKKEE